MKMSGSDPNISMIRIKTKENKSDDHGNYLKFAKRSKTLPQNPYTL